jgi:hypothetical protein
VSSGRRFRYPRRRPDTIEAEVDEELRHHLALRVQQLQREGMTADAAEEQARRQFGNLE